MLNDNLNYLLHLRWVNTNESFKSVDYTTQVAKISCALCICTIYGNSDVISDVHGNYIHGIRIRQQLLEERDVRLPRCNAGSLHLHLDSASARCATCSAERKFRCLNLS